MDLKVYLNQLWNKFNGKPIPTVALFPPETIHYQYDLDSIEYSRLWPSIYPYTVTTTTKVTHHYKSVVRDPARRWRKR